MLVRMTIRKLSAREVRSKGVSYQPTKIELSIYYVSCSRPLVARRHTCAYCAAVRRNPIGLRIIPKVAYYET
jgi:hypothetical protein